MAACLTMNMGRAAGVFKDGMFRPGRGFWASEVLVDLSAVTSPVTNSVVLCKKL
jgi:hypothetical protein